MDLTRSSIIPLDVQNIPQNEEQEGGGKAIPFPQPKSYTYRLGEERLCSSVVMLCPEIFVLLDYAILFYNKAFKLLSILPSSPGNDLLIHPVLFDVHNSTEGAVVVQEFPQIGECVIVVVGAFKICLLSVW
jgi:hypothetical protein